VIALIGAGGGLVAFLQYLDEKRVAEEREYRQALERWENFAPRSVSRGVQTIEVRGGDRFDLDTGLATSNPGPGSGWDLMFGCWPQASESLRASDKVEWADFGVVDSDDVGYREVRDADFDSRRHPQSGNPDLYMAHKSNVPGPGYAFAIRTSNNNVAKVQIVRYRSVDPNPDVCRNVTLRYEVFPIEPDPPRPRRP
jgi:hypothetical protein